jgi:glucosamine-6-phosphate deaminase
VDKKISLGRRFVLSTPPESGGIVLPRMRTFQVDHLHVSVFPGREEMGSAAAKAAAHSLQEAIRHRGEARLILASAPSQIELLCYLRESAVDWSRVTLFHMDEYIGLPAEHPLTFRHFLQVEVLSGIKPREFHGMRGEAADLPAEIARYSALIKAAPIDVVCLGIGENGHIAFNDPPVAQFDDPAVVKVVEPDAVCRQQQVNDGSVPHLGAMPKLGLTLTIPALMSGASLYCVVPGPLKAKAVRETLRGPIATSCPASILRRHPSAYLYLDEDSAALL